MKFLYISWIALFLCTLGRCIVQPKTQQGFATSTGNVPLSSNRRAMANPTQTPLHPLSHAYWEAELKSINKGKAYPQTQVKNPVKVKGGKTQQRGYFDLSYKGRKLEEVPDASKPINTIGNKIANLPATGTQICLYRCMSAEEASKAGISNTPKLADASLQMLTGHLGHPEYSKSMCTERQKSAGSVPPVLVEFLLRPNVQELLFSPDVAAIGTKSASTAVIAETALQKGEKTRYVVKEHGEGYVDGFMGIKSEKGSFSFALQASGSIPHNTVTKELLIRLTQSVKAIPLDKKPTCTPAP